MELRFFKAADIHLGTMIHSLAEFGNAFEVRPVPVKEGMALRSAIACDVSNFLHPDAFVDMYAGYAIGREEFETLEAMSEEEFDARFHETGYIKPGCRGGACATRPEVDTSGIIPTTFNI